MREVCLGGRLLKCGTWERCVKGILEFVVRGGFGLGPPSFIPSSLLTFASLRDSRGKKTTTATKALGDNRV